MGKTKGTSRMKIKQRCLLLIPRAVGERERERESHHREPQQRLSRYSDPFHTHKRRRRSVLRVCVTPLYDPSHDREKATKEKRQHIHPGSLPYSLLHIFSLPPPSLFSTVRPPKSTTFSFLQLLNELVFPMFKV